MEPVNTVRIVATNPEIQGNYIVINECDFDKKTMKLYNGPDNELVSVAVPNTLEAMAKEIEELRAMVAAKSGVEAGEGWGKAPE
jgi:hypothetical protein